MQDGRCDDVRAGPAGGRLNAKDAYDWKSTAAGRLDLDVWHNDREAIGSDGGDGGGGPLSLLKRVLKPIDRGANAFLREWLGAPVSESDTFSSCCCGRAGRVASAQRENLPGEQCGRPRSAADAPKPRTELKPVVCAGEQYSARLLSVADTPKPRTELNIDISAVLGPLIFLLLIQIPLPVALVLLVYEKERRLRMMMRMHGLTNGVYILVTYLYLIIVHILYNAVMMAFGAAVNLGMFRDNNVGAAPLCSAPASRNARRSWRSVRPHCNPQRPFAGPRKHARSI